MSASYPAGLEADVVLGDGGTALVRPIRPDDAVRLQAFHGRLSAESVYYRFFSARPRLSPAEVERFTVVDYTDRLALVLVLGDDIIGVARYDRAPGTAQAEVAFTVDDAHHRRGIATLLLEHLAAAARDRGITRFTALTLPDNHGMRTVFRNAGFDAKSGFAGGVVEFTLDIDASPDALARLSERVEQREHRAEVQSILPLLRPRSVAVIGASGRDPTSLGHTIVRNLVLHGFSGPVYPVNRSGAAVSGVVAYPSVADVPGPVDLAVLAVPADEVADTLAACAWVHVRAALVLTAGLDDDASREVGAFARRNGMRLVGPASLGAVNLAPAIALQATFAPVSGRPGRIALAVESGALGAAVVERAERVGIRFSSVVSLGTKVEVSANDLLHYWLEDEDTGVVVLYGGGVGNPRNFTRLARRFAAAKALLTLVPGGQDEADNALYRQLGVVRTRSVEELLDAARVVEALPLPSGDRVLVVTDSQSAGALAAQSLRAYGMDVTGIVQLGFDAAPSEYRDAATAAGQRADAVLAVYSPALPGDPAGVAAALAEVEQPAVLVSRGVTPAEAAIPVFRFVESAASSLTHLWEVARGRARLRQPSALRPGDVDEESARTVVERIFVEKPEGRLLRWDETSDLIVAAGIHAVEGRVVTSLDEALAAAERLGYPVALKAMRLERMGRSEEGGIALDLHDATGVASSYIRMREALGDGMAEALVQRMARGVGVECVVAVEPHEVFGPVISVGPGGVLADRFGRRPRRALPLTVEDALELVEESPVTVILRERGLCVDGLVDLVCRVGALADSVHEIEMIRCNPILVTEVGCAVLSARARVAPALPVRLPVRRL